MDRKLIEKLASDFEKDPDWIQRGLEACNAVGVSHDYFINRYLLKTEIPLREDVDAASMDVQKRWVKEGRL